MTRVIYIKNEPEWVGIDQNTDDINFEQYDELKTFLYNYFCNNQEDNQNEEEKWCSSIENALTRTTTNNVYSNVNTSTVTTT